MLALIVYESLWGNTERLANAIARALRPHMVVDLVTSADAPHTVEGYDLVIVGGPTHAFTMTRPSTRDIAATQHGAPHVPVRGIREWIEELDSASSAARVVTFDSRVDSPRLPGSAAKAARTGLKSRGYAATARPMSFYVHGYAGPLLEGEIERAGDWAAGLAKDLEPVVARETGIA